MVASLNDIRIEHQLAESQALLAGVVDSAMDAILAARSRRQPSKCTDTES